MPSAVFSQNRYKPGELWFDSEGKPFHPGVHYFVGGNTKVYGAALPRLRCEDFGERLIIAARKMLRRAGYPVILTQRMGIATNSHQCGTLRFGKDSTNSVLNTECRTHDIDNLFVVDSSFFPSSTALNPALTIAAPALRVAEAFKRTT